MTNESIESPTVPRACSAFGGATRRRHGLVLLYGAWLLKAAIALSGEAVAPPVFSMASGSYAGEVLVEVTCTTPGAVIRYTFNGQDPILIDPGLSSGDRLEIRGSTIIKARAWKEGMEPSDIATAQYLITGEISAGKQHTLGLKSFGEVFSWGADDRGQLGRQGSRGRPYPIPGLTNEMMVVAGGRHSLLIRLDATSKAWGKNANGQLGDGTKKDRSSPVVIAALTGACQVVAGDEFSAAVRGDGTVWTWGKNSSGQLGNGTTVGRSSGAAVPGLSNVVSIAAGASHMLALLSDRTVRAWGANGEGQVGDGTTLNRRSPVSVSGLSNVAQIAAGESQSYALDDRGQLWAWGDGAYGALGLGDQMRRTTPTAVPSLTNAAFVGSTLGPFGLAIDSLGLLWGWGKNTAFQLGDGTQQHRLSPVRVGALDEVVFAAGGEASGFAIRANGTLWAWGLNDAGQLGDGSSANRSTPVMIPDHTWSPGADQSGPSFVQETGGNGLIVIEAEHFSAHVIQDSHAWTPGTDLAGFSGDGHMTATPNIGTCRDGGSFFTNSPRLDYKVRFVTNGSHTVWVRGRAPSPSDDTLHLGLDGLPVGAADRICGFGPDWTWARQTLDDNNATVNVTAPGEHTVNIWMRDDGFVADKIVLSRSGGYTPTGIGPNESAQEARLYPNIDLTCPADGSLFDAGSAINLSAEATDPFGSILGVEFFQGTNAIGTDVDFPYSVTWTNPPIGTHLLSARVMDDDGMTATAGPVSVTVRVPDADGDALRDDDEIARGTNPYDPDTDYDGRSDWQEIYIDSTDPIDAASHAATRLGHWTFETPDFVAAHGAAPVEVANIGWSSGQIGQSAEAHLPGPTMLKYRDAEPNGDANVNLRRGTIRLWIRPCWTTVSLGGSGPGAWVRLVEVGEWTEDGSHGDWQLALNPDGDQIRWWADDGEGHVATTAYDGIQWREGQWHQIAVAYDETTVRIFVDGAEVACHFGSPAVFYPDRTIRGTAGLAFGSTRDAMASGGVRLDEIETFNYPLESAAVARDYMGASSVDTDCDGIADLWEINHFDTLAGYPNGDSDGDGTSNLLEYELDRGLILHWPFDEADGATVFDFSGHRNHGALQMGAGRTPGVHGSAVAFDGADHRVQLAQTMGLPVGQSNANFSAAFWLNLQEGATGVWRSLIHKGSLNEERTFSIWMRPESNALHARVSTTAGWDQGIEATSPISTNKWLHVACVMEDGHLKVYLDGRLDRDEPIPSEIVANSGQLSVGDDDWTWGTRCSLDDLRIYDRALSGEEIGALARAAADIPRIGMSLWLNADEGIETDSSGRVIRWCDLSPAGNDADCGMLPGQEMHRPLLVTNAPGAPPAVQFDDLQYADVPGLTNTCGDFSVFWVTRPDHTTNWNNRIQSPSGWGQFAFHTDINGSVHVGTDYDSRITPGIPPVGVPSNTVAVGQWQAFAFVRANGAGSFFKNGKLLASRPQGACLPWDGFRIGAPEPDGFDGAIAELFVYRGGLTDPDRQRLFAYLTARYSPSDDDWDSLPSEWETATGLRPDDYDEDGNQARDDVDDFDNDGLTNLEEFRNGTHPRNPDTDADGASDGQEVHALGSSPLDRDSDDDGMPDGHEARFGLDPNTADADRDLDGDLITNAEDANPADPLIGRLSLQIVNPSNGTTIP